MKVNQQAAMTPDETFVIPSHPDKFGEIIKDFGFRDTPIKHLRRRSVSDPCFITIEESWGVNFKGKQREESLDKIEETSNEQTPKVDKTCVFSLDEALASTGGYGKFQLLVHLTLMIASTLDVTQNVCVFYGTVITVGLFPYK